MMPGMPPPGPLGGPPPGGAPTGAPMPGSPMMSPAAPPAPPVGAPVGGPTSASPTPFNDLSDKLPHHFQLLDVAASTIETAINTGGFYKEPKLLAGVRSIHRQLSEVIANGAKTGGAFGSVPEAPAEPPGEGTGDDEGEYGGTVDSEPGGFDS